MSNERLKFERGSRFRGDYARLSHADRELFQSAIRRINQAYSARSGHWPPDWPAALRMKPVEGGSGVWEMTWSFSGPDGRATFQFVTIEGEPGIRWRRIGGHEIFREP